MTVQTIPPIDQITTRQRLALMAELWQVISKESEEGPIPESHREILQARDAQVSSGSTAFSDWEEEKKAIRRSTIER